MIASVYEGFDKMVGKKTAIYISIRVLTQASYNTVC